MMSETPHNPATPNHDVAAADQTGSAPLVHGELTREDLQKVAGGIPFFGRNRTFGIRGN